MTADIFWCKSSSGQGEGGRNGWGWRVWEVCWPRGGGKRDVGEFQPFCNGSAHWASTHIALNFPTVRFSLLPLCPIKLVTRLPHEKRTIGMAALFAQEQNHVGFAGVVETAYDINGPPIFGLLKISIPEKKI